MIHYPSELVPVIRKYLKTYPRASDPQVELPSDHDLELFLNIAFVASTRTEEGRRPGFRLALIPRPPKSESSSLSASTRGMVFGRDRSYTISEVVQLAAASEFNRTVIAVWPSGSSLKSALKIWGLLDTGDEWYRFIRREAKQSVQPPVSLTVTSLKAGDLSVSLGGNVIAALNGGKVFRPGIGALCDKRFCDFFWPAERSLHEEVIRHLGVKHWDDSGAEDQFPELIYVAFLERVLHRVSEKRHGGTILLIPDALSPSNPTLSKRLRIKYACNVDHAWRVLIQYLASLHRLIELEPWQLRDEMVSREYARALWHGMGAERDLDRLVNDVASFIANLTGVDGAVLLTDRFRIRGFGVESLAPPANLSHVQRIGEKKAVKTPIENYGTRHRSAFRLCSHLKQSVAFIVSQDGGLKAVRKVGSQVFFWPEVHDGSRGF